MRRVGKCQADLTSKRRVAPAWCVCEQNRNYAITRCGRKRQAEADLGRGGSQEENEDDLVPDFVPFVSQEWGFALRHEKKHDDLVADFVPFVSEEWVFALRHEKKRGDLVPDFCSFSVG